MNLEQLQEKAQEIQKNYRQIDRDQDELRHQASEIREDHKNIAKELEDSQKDEKELETFIETKQAELDEWKAEETAKQKKLEQIRLDSSALEQQEHFLQENLSRLQSEIEAFERESKDLLTSLAQSGDEIARKEGGIQDLKKAIEDCRKKDEQLLVQRQKCEAEKEERTESHKAFFEKRDRLSEKTTLLDKECFRLRSQAEKVEEQREGRISYMWEEYEITPNNALSYKKEELDDFQEIKKTLPASKRRSAGSVPSTSMRSKITKNFSNVTLSSRPSIRILSRQRRHWKISSRNWMRECGSSLPRFQDIQREFDKAFKELFGGGKGTLELAEGEDILEAGIRIISQPPGKKLQNMMQLSGGEKALTAIALLFAIQNLKPSPFCLLDEIEAALDDSNVGRFASYLQKLTKNTQFIIITHRRGTMNAADRLYGITMQEKGISTLVSVDLVENQLTR